MITELKIKKSLEIANRDKSLRFKHKRRRFSEKEKILVIHTENKGKVYYAGHSELKAYARYKRVQHTEKQIVLANVDYVEMFGMNLIKSYEIIEVLR